MVSLLAVKNFKALRAIDLSINQLNILSGINGVGKSSLIQILLLLKQTFEEGNIQEGLLLKGKYIDIGKAIDIFSESAPVEEGISIEIEVDDEFANLNFEYNRNLEQEYLLPLKSTQSEISANFSKSKLFSNNCRYLSAYRANPQKFYKLSSNLKEDEIGLHGEFVTQFLAIKPDRKIPIKNLAINNKKDDTLSTQVEEWLSVISEGIRIKTNINDEFELSTIKYQFKIGNDSTNLFTPLNVGYGFTSVLPIIVSILSANIGDILIIENPEDQLHPKAQAKLGFLFALAAKEGVQLFVETHSDHIINGIRVAVKNGNIDNQDVGVLFFQRDAKSKNHQSEIIRLNIDKKGRIDKYPKNFLDEWDKQLDELIKS